jgi:xanthine dehydrogenase YagR molybdenum-binding subunit
MAGSAAIVNAIHHATGKRVRHMPIRIEDLL